MALIEEGNWFPSDGAVSLKVQHRGKKWKLVCIKSAEAEL